MTTVAGSSVTSCFIDLATYDSLERNLYGGKEALVYFVRETRKCSWFSCIPIHLTRAAGQPGFGQEFSVIVSRGGDYVLNCWLRVTFPRVKLANGNGTDTIRWTHNLMHNLVEEASVTFNDLTAERLDSTFLDFWAAFTTCGSKRNGYDNMIGEYAALTEPSGELPQVTLVLPLPFFFARDSGVALPTAALPYNEIRINLKFRHWTDLIVFQDKTTQIVTPLTAEKLEGGAGPELRDVQVWITNAVVTNEERRLMGMAPRDIFIEQTQTAPKHVFAPLTNPNPHIDVRFSHAVKCLFFAVRNATYPANRSNYATSSPIIGAGDSLMDPDAAYGDPISSATLVYENSVRLNEMTAEYYSLVQPWYFARSIPHETGYHMYSYSLDVSNVDPLGSTNFGRLSNVSLNFKPSPKALAGALGSQEQDAEKKKRSGIMDPQKYEFIIQCVNHNVVRIKGGSMGFPIL